MKNPNQRILITGGAGYLGSVLCERLLATGYGVTAVDRLLYGQQSLLHLCANPNFDFIAADVRDEATMRSCVSQADVIIPLAAIVGAPACDRDPWLARSVNVGAIQLINKLRSPSQLVVIPITNSGYGTKSGEVYCTEETPLEPISLYGVTKVQAEKEILSRPRSISLRLATVFGASPRMRLDLLVNQFVYAAVTDGYVVIFEKDFKRNYIHIRDVADCFLHAIRHADQMTGQAFNAGLESANLSKEELALKIKEYVSSFYIHFADIGTDPDRRNYIVSNRRLLQAGFEAKRTLDEGIRELLKAYRLLGRHPLKNV